MKFLTFDTSLNKTYITLAEDEKILVSKIIESTDEKYHSALLIPTIVEILKSNNLTMQDIEAIGTNIGPGSFTGIRVCTTIARVFAQQLNGNLVGISSLQILSKINNTAKDSLVIMDARKNKAFCAVYSSEGDIIQEPSSLEKEDILELAKQDYFIIADEKIHEYLKSNDINSTNYETGDYQLGEFLAYFTYKSISNSAEDFHWAKVKPLYIQPPSISKPKAVG